jgi:hypothetical protein
MSNETKLTQNFFQEPKHILLNFMSIFPVQYGRLEKSRRLEEYKVSLARTLQLIDLNKWCLILCENTFNGSEEMLKDLLGIRVDAIKVAQLNFNSGSTNKGIGELDMAAKALVVFQELIDKASTVSYFTGRHIISNELVFEKTETLINDTLISNPNFFYLNGSTRESEKKGLYNDMFFSMKTAVFKAYVNEFNAKRSRLISKNVGSEQYLYSFINEHRLSFSWINNLGLIRRDKTKKFFIFSRSTLHIC